MSTVFRYLVSIQIFYAETESLRRLEHTVLRMTKKFWIPFSTATVLVGAVLASFLGVKISFRRPYSDVVSGFAIESSWVYAVMKAESGFREDVQSRAGAVGIMQIKPSTAEFICGRAKIPFSSDRLTDGAYNTELGCRYLMYLFERFPAAETAIAAYNAGEGTVRGWLKNGDCSDDGCTLLNIPYSETREYVKKVIKFKKIYDFLDR